jgi:hypothetical protein
MIHVVAMKCLTVSPLLIRIEIYEGVGVLKIEESESGRLCTDCTAVAGTRLRSLRRFKGRRYARAHFATFREKHERKFKIELFYFPLFTQ